MRKSDFHYELPPELIAQKPAHPRSASRLLHLASDGRLLDLRFLDLERLLRRGDLLVFNDTRVMPARLFGAKETGGRLEVLVERLLGARRLLAQVRASKPARPGLRLHLEGGVTAIVLGRQGEFFELELETQEAALEVLSRIGHMPLPPYIRRHAGDEDEVRYQTVFARQPGAVAAPTAGLHFDEPMLARLTEMGIEQAFITLHVGAGTFQPMRSDNIAEHRMHAEHVSVDAPTAARINAARREGRRVIAVGTTVVRALESAVDESGEVSGLAGETRIFIYPGYCFKVVDALVTNFHLPESTLLMLVCAFAGTDRVLGAYRHAVAQRYRFFSYGDATFVERPHC